jgi:hypothetical protein
MEATRSTQTSADFQRAMRNYISKERILQHGCENLKSYKSIRLSWVSTHQIKSYLTDFTQVIPRRITNAVSLIIKKFNARQSAILTIQSKLHVNLGQWMKLYVQTHYAGIQIQLDSGCQHEGSVCCLFFASFLLGSFYQSEDAGNVPTKRHLSSSDYVTYLRRKKF